MATNSDYYTAWDGNQYPGPPPEGWYLAEDHRWWPSPEIMQSGPTAEPAAEQSAPEQTMAPPPPSTTARSTIDEDWAPQTDRPSDGPLGGLPGGQQARTARSTRKKRRFRPRLLWGILAFAFFRFISQASQGDGVEIAQPAPTEETQSAEERAFRSIEDGDVPTYATNDVALAIRDCGPDLLAVEIQSNLFRSAFFQFRIDVTPTDSPPSDIAVVEHAATLNPIETQQAEIRLPAEATGPDGCEVVDVRVTTLDG